MFLMFPLFVYITNIYLVFLLIQLLFSNSYKTYVALSRVLWFKFRIICYFVKESIYFFENCFITYLKSYYNFHINQANFY